LLAQRQTRGISTGGSASVLAGCGKSESRRDGGVVRLRTALLRSSAAIWRKNFFSSSRRSVGRVVAILVEEPVSAQTVSRNTRTLDAAMRAFHEAALGDDWACLVLDGVWMKVRRAFGPQRVLLLVAYGVRGNGERSVSRRIGFCAGQERKPSGLGRVLAGPAPTRLTRTPFAVRDHGWLCGSGGYPPDRLSPDAASVRRLADWVHKMRNLSEAVRRRDHDKVKRQGQKIYQASSLAEARQAFRHFQWHWQTVYPALVRRVKKDLPELLNFFQFPRHMWKKLRTTNTIERCFAEARRHTRPMVVFTNVASLDRIIYAIFDRFN
jgi:putative transposase